jgi:hypothetical protein
LGLEHPSFKQVNEARKAFISAYHQYWLEHSLFTWQWWFLLITAVGFWITWWILVDKTRIHTILNFGLILAIISIILDMLGMNYNAWAYPIRLYWAFIPPLLPYDLTYIPITYMLTYQRYGNSFVKSLIAFTIVSVFPSFMAESFMQWIGVYQVYNWKHIYSFLIYVLIACVSWFVVRCLSSKNSN